jgi:DNA-binding HxlR family transcriptional regulator
MMYRKKIEYQPHVVYKLTTKIRKLSEVLYWNRTNGNNSKVLRAFHSFSCACG